MPIYSKRKSFRHGQTSKVWPEARLLKSASYNSFRFAIYTTYRVVELNRSVQVKASELRERYHLSFWDSTIVANALLADVPLLYSEDMHDGLVIENKMTIRNPLK